MKIRAVIFDVYGTLLDLSPAGDGEERWKGLWEKMLKQEPPLTRMDFAARCERVISREHLAARARGIAWPEILWPAIVGEVLPEIKRLPAEEEEAFVFHLAQSEHHTLMRNETAEFLRWLKNGECLLGIASNAQAYTLRELDEGLAVHGLSPQIFERDLSFWSFEHGFSKPDAHVFRILSVRLLARGIPAAETLMVGDRVDNDIEPARTQGWRTWQVTGPPESGNPLAQSSDSPQAEKSGRGDLARLRTVLSTEKQEVARNLDLASGEA